jgi:hypothetical protein
MNHESEGMIKVAGVTLFQALSSDFMGELKKTKKNFIQDSWCLSQDSN